MDSRERRSSKPMSAMFTPSILIKPEFNSASRNKQTPNELFPDPVLPTIPLEKNDMWKLTLFHQLFERILNEKPKQWSQNNTNYPRFHKYFRRCRRIPKSSWNNVKESQRIHTNAGKSRGISENYWDLCKEYPAICYRNIHIQPKMWTIKMKLLLTDFLFGFNIEADSFEDER